jgi:hypothetical protein
MLVSVIYNGTFYHNWDEAKLRALIGDEAYEAAIPAPRYISKFLVLNRVVAAGKFADAMTALGGPGSLQYELWSAAQELDANDEQVRGLITAIGLDPAEVLA